MEGARKKQKCFLFKEAVMWQRKRGVKVKMSPSKTD